jgi:DNA-binding transcriptional ArsR family regulator
MYTKNLKVSQNQPKRGVKMLNKEREQEIMSILKTTNSFVSVKQLCDTLFASESSVRRDLKSLEDRGLVKRSYGGASLVTNYSNIVTFNHRTRQNITAKRDIAKKAASLIKDSNIIFLDQSSTAFYMANELINRSSITVVTNNVEIMMLLSNSGIKLISSGGILSDENRNCLIGGDAQRTFENVFADNAYILEDEGIYCGWQNSYNEKTGVCDFYLTVFEDDGEGYVRYDEVQREKKYSARQLSDALERAGFEVAGFYGDYNKGTAEDTCERWYIAAKKA